MSEKIVSFARVQFLNTSHKKQETNSQADVFFMFIDSSVYFLVCLALQTDM